ncbi:MAG: ankyrin repeat protein 50-like [Paucimonas sp.]|nr:ankyrin repeat protein 50-like [Paucimonas sp.]
MSSTPKVTGVTQSGKRKLPGIRKTSPGTPTARLVTGPAVNRTQASLSSTPTQDRGARVSWATLSKPRDPDPMDVLLSGAEDSEAPSYAIRDRSGWTPQVLSFDAPATALPGGVIAPRQQDAKKSREKRGDGVNEKRPRNGAVNGVESSTGKRADNTLAKLEANEKERAWTTSARKPKNVRPASPYRQQQARVESDHSRHEPQQQQQQQQAAVKIDSPGKPPSRTRRASAPATPVSRHGERPPAIPASAREEDASVQSAEILKVFQKVVADSQIDLNHLAIIRSALHRLEIIDPPRQAAPVGMQKRFQRAVARNDTVELARIAEAAHVGGWRLDANVTLDRGRTPLTTAASHGWVKMVPLLVDLGARPGLLDATGMTPLYLAAIKNFSNTVAKILEAGANPRQRVDGLLPICAAAAAGADKTVAQLLESGKLPVLSDPHDDPLLTAASAGQCKVIEAIFDVLGRHDPDGSLTLYGATVLAAENALVAAARAGKEEAVSVIIAAGISPDDCGSDEETALTAACARGLKDIAEVLLRHGASVHLHDERGCSPLLAAAQGGHHKTVKLLLAHGADASAADDSGQSAMQLALETGDQKLLALLKGAPGTQSKSATHD